jgi:hypothetical protein
LSEDVQTIVEGILEREIGVEVGSNFLTNIYFSNMDNKKRLRLKEEFINILESVQILLLDVDSAKKLIEETARKYEVY